MPATVEELIARLRRDPNDREAFSTLRKHYHRMADYASLVNLLEGWASQQTDSETAADAFVEAAQFAQNLGDSRRGFSLLERALSRSPGHSRASDQIEALIEHSGDYERLVRLIQQRIQVLSKKNESDPQAALLHFRLGELWRHRFSRPDRAIYHYRKAFEIDPTLVSAIYAARELYRNEGNWRMASGLCEQEVSAEREPARKAALLRELAGIRHMHLNDMKGAINALTQASEFAGNDVNILYELAGLLLQDAAHSKNPQVSESRKQQASEMLFRVAELTLSELHALSEQQGPGPDAELFQRNFAQHALAYVQAALDANPGHSRALELLETLATESNVYEQLMPERWVAFLEYAPDDPLAVTVRQRLGHAYAKAGQLHDAISCLEPLLDGSDVWAAEVLLGLYQSSEQAAGAERALAVLIAALPPEQRVSRLREMVQLLASLNRQSEAVAYARQALDLSPADAETLGFLEDALQGMKRWDELRDLSLTAARVPGLSVDAKLYRLRLAARISEEHLSDADGAIGSWRAVASLDPANREATDALERLLFHAGRWDDLIQVLDRAALAYADPHAQAKAYHSIARIHRDARHDATNAIEYLLKVRDLLPDDLESASELSDLFLQEGRYHDAVPLLRERLGIVKDTKARIPILLTLGLVLEEQLHDDESALKVYQTLLEESSNDIKAFEGIERIESRQGRQDKLLEILEKHAKVVEAPARSGLLVRMGHVASGELNDLERAAGYFQQAVELNPTDTAALDALCDLFERTSRHEDLVVYLQKRADLEEEAESKSELLRRVGRILTDSLNDNDNAAQVWKRLVEIKPDAEALKALASYYGQREEYDTLSDTLAQLIPVIEDPQEKRDLLYAQAEILAERLNDPQGAIKALQTLVTDLDPGFTPALALLVTLSEQTESHDILAHTLEIQLGLTKDLEPRLAIIQRLADLYGLLDQPHDAERALRRWCELDADDPEPQRRIAVMLRGTDRAQDLLVAVDALARLESEPVLRDRAALEGAHISQEQLNDVDGAWQRLVPAVQRDNPDAVGALRALAKATDRGLELAALYVDLAQQVEEPRRQVEYWRTAAEVYEHFTPEKSEALESMLRALAVDLADEALLDEVDRLAIEIEDWPRLEQVYDTLLRSTDDVHKKCRLLFRHADILEKKAQDASAALDRLLRAIALDPDDAELIKRVETLARANDRAEELLVVYDRLRSRADAPHVITDALLRSVRTCLFDLGNMKRALQYLSQAARIAIVDDTLASQVEDLAQEMDAYLSAAEAEEQTQKTPAAQETMLETYTELYSQGRADMPTDAFVHMAHYLSQTLGKKAQALEALKAAANAAPGNEAVLDSLLKLCTEQDMLPELSALLGGLADDAMDAPTAAVLLERRGKLLEERLERPEEAARSYQQLLLLRHDKDIADRLHRCLRKTAKFNDLLVALSRALDRTEVPDERFVLYRDIARVWEDELNNRYEAVEALQKALQIRPDDRDTLEHIERLTTAQKPPDDEMWQDVDEQNEIIEEEPLVAAFEGEADLRAPVTSIPPPLPPEDKQTADADPVEEIEESDDSTPDP